MENYSRSWQFSPNLYPLPLVPTTAQVLQAKHFLSQKLVLSAPDKNSGISDLYCPSILWKEMHTTFYCNINFHRQPHLSTECVLQHFKYTFDSKKWCSIGTFNIKGSLPYPYKIRKFKDLSRSRSIISYFHHPYRTSSLKLSNFFILIFLTHSSTITGCLRFRCGCGTKILLLLSFSCAVLFRYLFLISIQYFSTNSTTTVCTKSAVPVLWSPPNHELPLHILTK